MERVLKLLGDQVMRMLTTQYRLVDFFEETRIKPFL